MNLAYGGGSAPLTSYVIPFYNGNAHLGGTIQSILSQTYKDVEIVVVDDGSEQDCKPITGSFGPCVRVIRTANHGVSGARNVGLAAAHGVYVTFIDQDDVVYPRHAELLSAEMEADPTVDGCYCSVLVLREGVPPEEELFDRYPSSLALFKARMTLSMGSLMFRRSSLEGLGGFDLALSNIGEDWDFCLRVARYRQLVYVEQPLFGFRRHTAQASRGADRLAKGALSVLRKHRLFDGPGSFSRAEAREARAGILGYWAQWYRARIKAAGPFSKETVELVGHLLANPCLMPFVVLPPLRRLTSRP